MDEWSAWQVMMGIAGVLGVGALVGWYFQETLKALLPSPQRLAGLMRRRDLPLPSGERFVVLIADLQGDDDKRTHTRHSPPRSDPTRVSMPHVWGRALNGALKVGTFSRRERDGC